MPKTINDFTDAELASMIRRSIYAKNAEFDEPDSGSGARFLLVLAVSYGPEDNVSDLPGALESFAELIQSDDWEERSFEVYDHYAAQHFFDARMEDVEYNRDEEEEDDSENDGDTLA